jgi:hypothetical protein
MSANGNNTHAWVFWKRFTFALGLVFVVAVAYAAKQSSEQSKPAPSAPEAKQGEPVLNGTWKLNRDQSDDPREKLRSAMQDRDQNGPMGGHGGMGGGGVTMGVPGIGVGGMGRPRGGPGGGMGRGQGAGSEDQRARLRDLVEAPDQLRVAQKGPEIDMTDTQSRVRTLFTDGRKVEKPKKDSDHTQVKAHWERGTLVTEEKGPNGEKVSHSYEMVGEAKQLADTLTIESKKLNTPIIVRSVYDRAESAKAE